MCKMKRRSLIRKLKVIQDIMEYISSMKLRYVISRDIDIFLKLIAFTKQWFEACNFLAFNIFLFFAKNLYGTILLILKCCSMHTIHTSLIYLEQCQNVRFSITIIIFVWLYFLAFCIVVYDTILHLICQGYQASQLHFQPQTRKTKGFNKHQFNLAPLMTTSFCHLLLILLNMIKIWSNFFLWLCPKLFLTT